MGVRRERPPIERGADSILIRLPDGTTRTMAVDDARSPVTSALCCFCGRSVEDADPARVTLSAGWSDAGNARTQTWAAHHDCLARRMHESAAGTGPFFAAGSTVRGDS